jgi:hypothetical protein
MINHSKRILVPITALEGAGEHSVLAIILAFFDNVARRDKKAMLELLLPDGSTTIIRNGQVSQFNLCELADRLPGGTRKIEERIHNPLILIDDDIAMVWARYEFLIDGKVAQYGTNLFSLILCDRRWMIASVAYNSRQSQ